MPQAHACSTRCCCSGMLSMRHRMYGSFVQDGESFSLPIDDVDLLTYSVAVGSIVDISLKGARAACADLVRSKDGHGTSPAPGMPCRTRRRFTPSILLAHIPPPPPTLPTACRRRAVGGCWQERGLLRRGREQQGHPVGLCGAAAPAAAALQPAVGAGLQVSRSSLLLRLAEPAAGQLARLVAHR